LKEIKSNVDYNRTYTTIPDLKKKKNIEIACPLSFSQTTHCTMSFLFKSSLSSCQQNRNRRFKMNIEEVA
jgi:hypothetical protein